MDFSDTEEEAAFRAEVASWLAVAAAEYAHPLAASYAEPEMVRRAQAWQRTKREAGYASITLPKAIGGLGGTAMQQLIFDEEEGRYHVPTGPFIHVGVRMTVPALLAYGTKDQQDRYIEPTLRGDTLWCQLYSEPGAGSDLAGVRTRAVRDGDNWIVNGQKVWSSWAHHANKGILLARTDATVPKHKGLTFFLIDMDQPGIEIRPIRQITGACEFNETFLTDAVVRDADRMGGVGDGWKVAMATLMSERLIGDEAGESITFDNLFEIARGATSNGRPALEDGGVCDKLAHWYAQGQGLAYYRYRLLTLMSKGGVPGPEAALAKLVFATRVQEMAAYAMELDNSAGAFAGTMNPRQRRSFDAYMFAIVMRIAGGTDEILRNQIGERVLGLPGEPRLDKDLPFQQLVS
jgi:alkylation response protein AidB-like acyl-CoA dehydrogenase